MCRLVELHNQSLVSSWCTEPLWINSCWYFTNNNNIDKYLSNSVQVFIVFVKLCTLIFYARFFADFSCWCLVCHHNLRTAAFSSLPLITHYHAMWMIHKFINSKNNNDCTSWNIITVWLVLFVNLFDCHYYEIRFNILLNFSVMALHTCLTYMVYWVFAAAHWVA